MKRTGRKSVAQSKGLKRRSSPRLRERRQGGLFLLVPRRCGPLCLVPLDLLVLLRLLILLPLAINGCPVSRRSFETPARPGNCFACGKFGHWRSECVQSARGSKGNLDSR